MTTAGLFCVCRDEQPLLIRMSDSQRKLGVNQRAKTMQQASLRPNKVSLSDLSSFHKTKIVFLVAAFLSFLLSVGLWFLVDRELGLFVGLWVPAIHSLGTLVLTGEDS